MDHLPRPPGRKPFLIPCLSTRECAIHLTVQSFVPFGLSNSFYHPTVGWATDRSSEEVADFAQTWLYFGSLSLFTNRRISVAEYTRWDEEGQRCILDSSVLPSHLMEWYEQLLALGDDAAILAAKEQVVLFLDFVGRALVWLDTTGNYSIYWPVILACNVMINSVYGIVKYKPPAPTLDPRVPLSRYLQQRSIDAGWCPQTICSLVETDLWYLIYLDPLETRGSHVQCSDDRCLVLNVDESNYVTRHISPDCTCQDISVPQEELVSAIRAGGVALIQAQRAPEDSVRSFEFGGVIGASNTQTQLPYIAISHVWSDGLGNVKANAIPACQFDRLAAVTLDALQCPAPLPNNQFSPIPSIDATRPVFWIDTLCVPVSGQGRKTAIAQMARVYNSAYAALVLDAELWCLDQGNMSAHEILFRIRTSAWYQRLWTLQEGALSRHLIFKFRASLLDRTSLLLNLVDHFHSRGPVGCKVTHNLLSSLTQALISQSMRVGDTGSFTRVWGATQTRSVSKQEDIPICLATLLGFDPAPVLAAIPPSYERRLMAFYSLTSEYHPCVIFAPGPKLNAPGFRWAPASFCSHWPKLSHRHTMGLPGFTTSSPKAQRTSGGLQIQGFSGLRLIPDDQLTPRQGDHVCLKNAKAEDRKCLVQLKEVKAHAKPGFNPSPVEEVLRVDFSLPWAFILEAELFAGQDTWVKGLLCKVKEERDGVLFVEREAIVGLQAIHRDFVAWDGIDGEAVHFEEVEPERVWLVD
ncbi:MAG: hypothetical protein M1839_006245 [Geoglossum umbratile]|nr:MAG: hypothetical protein M1839_006245 [Geoglossum umbratile]